MRKVVLLIIVNGQQKYVPKIKSLTLFRLDDCEKNIPQKGQSHG